MGPSVADASSVLCKPAYGGNVYIYYSLDSGETWETLTILETFAYRKEDFTEVSLNNITSTIWYRSRGGEARVGFESETFPHELTRCAIVCTIELYEHLFGRIVFDRRGCP